MPMDIQEYLNIDKLHKSELLAMKLASMLRNGPIHLTTQGEGFWYRENGLYDLFDQVTDFVGCPKSDITIDSWNLKENHSEYNVNVVNEIYHCEFFVNPPRIEIPTEFKVAALFGRTNRNRLLFHKNLHKLNRDELIYTFHQDLIKDGWPIGMHRFVESGGNYLDVFNTLPISDIGTTLTTPIQPPQNIYDLKDTYRRIGLEIVVETVDQGFFVTEKTLRPMYYGRPFIVIGAENFEYNLRKLGFEVNFNYGFKPHKYWGELKVEYVIDCINNWYVNIDKEQWFKSIIPILEHNQRVLNNYARTNGKLDQLVVDSLK